MTYSIDAYRQLFGLGGSISHRSVHLVRDPDCLQSADHPFLRDQTETVGREDFEVEEESAALETQTA